MKLKLITTETFGTVSCDFYRNMNDDMLLTREQIGQALEYKDPMVAIGKIHKRHKRPTRQSVVYHFGKWVSSLLLHRKRNHVDIPLVE